MTALADKTLTIFGDPVQENAVEQIHTVLAHPDAREAALMADHHLGYSMPIGGVVAYDNAISPSGVGFDIACGNMCVRTNLMTDDVPVKKITREISKAVDFGLGGRAENARPDHELFDDELWPVLDGYVTGLKQKAAAQLGTVGSGNHYVDLLTDDEGRLWVANHFGSRGLGHTIATGYMNLINGDPFGHKLKESEEGFVVRADSVLGEEYIAGMNLAGAYAYAGRESVIAKVLGILGAHSDFEVHNHHNFAWFEGGMWVVRKGATPLTYAPAFIGGSMGDISVIVKAKEGAWSEGAHIAMPHGPMDIGALGSAPHGAGRVMSRTAAAGKLRRMWYCGNRNCDFQPFRSESNKMSGYDKGKCPQCGSVLRKGRIRDRSTAAIDWTTVRKELNDRGIFVVGAGADESPGVYKSLADVLACHENIEILYTLWPLGVVMAGDDVFDPYKD